jgi:hypothetical protein
VYLARPDSGSAVVVCAYLIVYCFGVGSGVGLFQLHRRCCVSRYNKFKEAYAWLRASANKQENDSFAGTLHKDVYRVLCTLLDGFYPDSVEQLEALNVAYEAMGGQARERLRACFEFSKDYPLDVDQRLHQIKTKLKPRACTCVVRDLPHWMLQLADDDIAMMMAICRHLPIPNDCENVWHAAINSTLSAFECIADVRGGVAELADDGPLQLPPIFEGATNEEEKCNATWHLHEELCAIGLV